MPNVILIVKSKERNFSFLIQKHEQRKLLRSIWLRGFRGHEFINVFFSQLCWMDCWVAFPPRNGYNCLLHTIEGCLNAIKTVCLFIIDIRPPIWLNNRLLSNSTTKLWNLKKVEEDTALFFPSDFQPFTDKNLIVLFFYFPVLSLFVIIFTAHFATTVFVIHPHSHSHTHTAHSFTPKSTVRRR